MYELVNDIKALLNIQGGFFIDQAIEEYLKGIDTKDYQAFFNDLSGDKFAYKSGMDRVAIVSASYKERKRALLMRNVPNKANELFNKLYAVKQQVNDKFMGINYQNIKSNGENYFTPAELMVIDNLKIDELMKVIDTQSPNITINAINHEMEKINQAKAEQLALKVDGVKAIKHG